MNEISQTVHQKIEQIMPNLKALPQVDCKTKHYFGPGLYVREVTMPTGAVVIGKPHKTEHLCVMLQGHMRVKNEDGEVIKDPEGVEITKKFIQELKALVMVMENTFEEVDDDSRN